jgi:hypothetical protein
MPRSKASKIAGTNAFLQQKRAKLTNYKRYTIRSSGAGGHCSLFVLARPLPLSVPLGKILMPYALAQRLMPYALCGASGHCSLFVLARPLPLSVPLCKIVVLRYVSIRQHTSAYVSIRQHTSAYVSIRQHTSA